VAVRVGLGLGSLVCLKRGAGYAVIQIRVLLLHVKGKSEGYMLLNRCPEHLIHGRDDSFVHTALQLPDSSSKPYGR
jgi:hypothetical protein